MNTGIYNRHEVYPYGTPSHMHAYGSNHPNLMVIKTSKCHMDTICISCLLTVFSQSQGLQSSIFSLVR